MGELAPRFFGFPPNDREACCPICEKCCELESPVAANCSIVGSSHDSLVRFLRRMLDTPARHKIMFGSDCPVYTRAQTEQAWVQFLTREGARRDAESTDEELHLLFSESVQGYLDRDLPAPG